MHLTVGQLADAQGDKKGVQYTKRFVAALAEVAMLQAEAIARDIEAFAKYAHAPPRKRTNSRRPLGTTSERP